VKIYNSGNKLRPSYNKIISLIIVMLKYSQILFTTGQKIDTIDKCAADLRQDIPM
jgi:hypothetical protein